MSPLPPSITSPPRRRTGPRPILDLAALRAGAVVEDPAPHVVGHGLVRPDAQAGLRRDVPKPRARGFLPIDSFRLRGRARNLVAELDGPDLAAALGELFALDLRRCERAIALSAHGLPRPMPGGEPALLTLLIGLENARLHPAPRLRLVRAGTDAERSPALAPADSFVAYRAGGAPRIRRALEHGRVLRVEWFGDTPEERGRKWRRTAQFLGALFPR